jgi:HTH-type transcriptional regulator / antitoxin HigA
MEIMSALAKSTIYAELLAKTAPKVIRNEAENQVYIEMLYALEQKPNPRREERELADLLTVLIENFEDAHYSLPRSSPLQALEFLMAERGLKQKDLVSIFGARSTVSQVISGKRELTKGHISRLSEFFHVSPEIFF